MADITNQQVLEGVTEMLGGMVEMMGGMATKDDLKQFVTKDELKRIENKMATKDDLKRMEIRLDRRIRSSHTANLKHHLDTRADIGDLNSKFDNLREGLARAAQPIKQNAA